jgi:predicted ATPase/signal transduction histidine kinase
MLIPMMQLPGYSIADLICEDEAIAVYQGYAQSSGELVAIKLLKTKNPELKDVAQLKHEYNITEDLHITGIIKSRELISYHNGYSNQLALILEAFEGQFLKSLITATGLELTRFLHIAIQITEILGELHTRNLIHKDIQPQNILFHPSTGKVKLTNFSNASQLSKENPKIATPNLLEGTLAYMSPEQTGRMNRTVDYRSDFYSLGVTFYELLTGQLPFYAAHDPVELVHCHIAKIPIPPVQVRKQGVGNHSQGANEIPQVVSDIVMKLLAKTAEERYQSAYGLKADLEQCLAQFQMTGAIDRFQLGQQDLSNQFQIPQKLYGREAEVADLMAAFERVSQGKTEMMLVGGYSGIGKSSLVNEVHRPIVRQQGYFISGKFDQLKRNIPYASLIQAFQELMRQLLTESQARVEVWQEKLLQAFGPNGQVIIDVIPEVELIVGLQPPAPQLGPAEAQNRFNLVFQRFIRVFADAEHPLVLFLDDLQWADAASLNLIQCLMTDLDSQYLFLIGAYRDNEVSPTHPLMLTLAEIQLSGATLVETIVLRPLAIAHVTQLISDTLSCESAQVKPLAEMVLNKTQGNPFFLTQLLKSLYQDELLTFNSHAGCWQWDIEQIEGMAITDNVVELMISKIQKFSQSTQQALQLAACIGNRFNLNVLAIICEQSPAATAVALWEALRAGLILPLSETYKIPLVLHQSELETYCNTAVQVDYKFLHDRVQQAAYLLIPENQQQQVHLNVGQLLLQNIEPAELEEQIFDILGHLNAGETLITEPAERYELAGLNLKAGKRAKLSSAFETALKFLKTGMNCLPQDSWEAEYSLTLMLYLETGEAEYLNGNNEQALQIFDRTLNQVKTNLDRYQAHEYKIMCYRMENNLNSAYEIGLSTLELVGIPFEPYPTDDYLLKQLLDTKAVIGDRAIDSLATLPEMQDPEKLIAQRILKEVWPIAYFLGSKALHISGMKMTQLSIEYGNSPISVFGYMLYAFCLVFEYGEVEAGCEVGQLSLRLHDIFKTKELEANIFNMWGGLILHYKEHISQGKPYLLKGFNSGLETGSYQWSGYCSVNFLWQSFFGNESLQKTAEIADGFIPTLKKIDKNMLNYHLIAREAIVNLTEPIEVKDQLIGQWVNERDVLEFAEKSNDFLTNFVIYLNKLALSNWYGNYTKAVEFAQSAEQFVGGAQGIFINPVFYFHQSIALAGAYAAANEADQPRYWNTLQRNLKKFEQWAAHCPSNYLHKALLIQAEIARISGQDYQAMDLYDRAIAAANENGYTQNAALANELAARLYRTQGREKLAEAYLREARSSYLQWGAIAKANDLDQTYLQLLSKPFATAQTEIDKTTYRPANAITQTHRKTLDLATVIKASQTLSSEIVLSKLLEKLMQLVLENAGAQKGFLILENGGNLTIEAEGTVDREDAVLLQSTEVITSQLISIAIINYVVRTQESVVLNEATVEGFFTTDPYILKYKPKSILCVPLTHQGKLISILYLENNLTTGAFTTDRLEVLKVISSQAAISIENARLYTQLEDYSHTLEQKVEERTGELKEKNSQLENTLYELQQTQAQLVQSGKMSSLGQLVAGVAHEINNPVNFIYGNLTHANNYTQDLLKLLQLYQRHYPSPVPEVQAEAEAIDLNFLIEDLPNLLSSMKIGADRIKKIVASLRNFSRMDEAEVKAVNIHEGIDSTLMILQHRLKAGPEHAAIELVKAYGQLPLTECYAGQLNQVFMNILSNAIDALEEFNQQRTFEKSRTQPSQIQISTEVVGHNWIAIRIADNGPGISENVRARLFDPFFTTKPVGKGTGLGLSISYEIVVEKHGGKLYCQSAPGQGTEFVIEIPMQQQVQRSQVSEVQ